MASQTIDAQSSQPRDPTIFDLPRTIELLEVLQRISYAEGRTTLAYLIGLAGAEARLQLGR